MKLNYYYRVTFIRNEGARNGENIEVLLCCCKSERGRLDRIIPTYISFIAITRSQPNEGKAKALINLVNGVSE